MPTTEIAPEQLSYGVISVLDLMVVCGLITSKSEGRRLIQQGGVFIDDVNAESVEWRVTFEQLKIGVIIRKGKKTYHKVLLK